MADLPTDKKNKNKNTQDNSLSSGGLFSHLAGTNVAVVESVQTFPVHFMELALAVLVHQQFANNIQLLLLVPQAKKPWTLNPTNSSNVRKYMSKTVPCWSIFEQNCTLLARLQSIPWKFSSCVTVRIYCDFTKDTKTKSNKTVFSTAQ